MRLKPLCEQVVVVTGASSGIGRETALMLARRGAVVVGLSRSEEHLVTLVAEILHAGGSARHIVCDVTDLPQLQAAANLTEEWFGRIDTWVNNAGVLLYGKFSCTPPNEFRRVMEINYMGTGFVLRSGVGVTKLAVLVLDSHIALSGAGSRRSRLRGTMASA